jgi:hypothetical protein
MEPDQKPNVIYQDVSIDDQSRIREFWWMMAMVVCLVMLGDECGSWMDIERDGYIPYEGLLEQRNDRFRWTFPLIASRLTEMTL